jgi:four helix bundle protein
VKIERFEDLLVWQKGFNFVTEVYILFRFSKDYSFKDQIQRASVSVTNNIAEGFERLSNKDFKKFLYISKGSCGEVRSMLYLAKALGYINVIQLGSLYNQTVEVSKMLSGLIKTL